MMPFANLKIPVGLVDEQRKGEPGRPCQPPGIIKDKYNLCPCPKEDAQP
jgi:hypothetical protein